MEERQGNQDRMMAMAERQGISIKSKARDLKAALKKKCLHEIKKARESRANSHRNFGDEEGDEDITSNILAREWMSFQSQFAPHAVSGARGMDLECARAVPYEGARRRNPYAAMRDVASAADSEDVDIMAFDGHECDYLAEAYEEECRGLELQPDDLIQMYEELAAELKSEARDVLSLEMEQEETIQQEEIEAAIEAEIEDPVFCPICQKNTLSQEYSLISCVCGFNFDTGASGMGLYDFRTYLLQVADAHNSTQCPGQAQFFLQPDPATETVNLVILCEYCRLSSIVNPLQ